MPKVTHSFSSIRFAAAILLPVFITALAFACYEMTIYPNGNWPYSSVNDAAAHGVVFGVITGIAPSALVTAIYLFRVVRTAGIVSKGFLLNALLSFFIPFFIVAATYYAIAYSRLQEIVFGGPPHTPDDYARELLMASIFGAVTGLVVLNIWMLRRLFISKRN